MHRWVPDKQGKRCLWIGIKLDYMKRYLLTIAIVLVSLPIFTQKVGVSFSPIKNGIGCFVESPTINDVSLVSGFDYGQYRAKDMFGKESVNIDVYYFGLKYDKWIVAYKYNDVYANHNRLFNLDNVHRHSIELGFLMPLVNRFDVGFMYDVMNYEGRMMFAFKLN